MPRLGPLDLPLEVLDPARHAVKLTDPVVLLNGVSQDGQERSDLRAPFPLCVRVRRGGLRVVAVVLEVLRIAGEQDRSGLVVVGKGRKRQRDAVLAPRGRPEVAADVLGQEREGLVEPLDPPDVVEGQLLREVVLDRPVDILHIAARKRLHEPAEILDDLERLLGQARKPRLLPELLDEARLPQEDLGLPGRPEPRRGIPHHGEAKPAALLEHLPALVALVVGETVPLGPQAHVVDSEGGRDFGERRVEEDLGLGAGELGQKPEDRGGAALRDREKDDPKLGENDGSRFDVARE